MFLRGTKRVKDGKEHHYWSVVENRRLHSGRTVQKTVLYLGEISDSQRASWCEAIEVFKGGAKVARPLKLFAASHVAAESVDATTSVRVDLSRFELRRPREWGASWLITELWRQLNLDEFWTPRLKRSRKGTNWLHVLMVLVTYRLLDPGSEWRLHRLWYERSALGDLLGGDFSLAQKNTLYRCLDKLLEHKEAFFSHLKQRWQDLFGAKYEVLLYDLTSTYFESSPPHVGEKRQYGYS